MLNFQNHDVSVEHVAGVFVSPVSLAIAVGHQLAAFVHNTHANAEHRQATIGDGTGMFWWMMVVHSES